MPNLTPKEAQQFADLQHRRDCAFVSKHIESNKLMRDKFAPLRDKETAIDGIAAHYRLIMDNIETKRGEVRVKEALHNWALEQHLNNTYDAFDFKKTRR